MSNDDRYRTNVPASCLCSCASEPKPLPPPPPPVPLKPDAHCPASYGNVWFKNNSYDIRSESEKYVHDFVCLLRSPGGRFKLVGHTDSKHGQFKGENLKLGLQRAVSLYNKIKRMSQLSGDWESIERKLEIPTCPICRRSSRASLSGGRPIYNRHSTLDPSLCADSFDIQYSALENCPYTNGEINPIEPNHFGSGEDNPSGRLVNKRVDIIRTDRPCCECESYKQMRLTFDSKEEDFQEKTHRLKCKIAGGTFYSAEENSNKLSNIFKKAKCTGKSLLEINSQKLISKIPDGPLCGGQYEPSHRPRSRGVAKSLFDTSQEGVCVNIRTDPCIGKLTDAFCSNGKKCCVGHGSKRGHVKSESTEMKYIRVSPSCICPCRARSKQRRLLK